MGRWSTFVKLGINHHLLYPASMESSDVHRATLPELLRDDRFEVIDLFVPDEATFAEEAPLIRASGKQVVYNCPLMNGEGRSPHSPDRDVRERTLQAVKRHVDRAVRLGADKMVVASGVDPGAEHRGRETDEFARYLQQLCAYAPDDLLLLIEPFDRSIGKNLLIGPTAEAARLVERVRGNGLANLGLLTDMGHVPLMEETFREAVRVSAPFLHHIHLGSCVMRDSNDPLYGDMHPPWGYPGGENDVAETAAFLEELFAAGYLGEGRRPTVTFEMRPYPGLTESESIELFLAKFNEAWAIVEERLR